MARILIIDDVPDVRFTLREVLEDAGHVVDEAAGGKPGIDMHTRDPYPLVITDVIMPWCDGLEVLFNVKGVDPRTRVIVISGGGRHVAAGPVLRQAEILGAEKVLLKPISADELLRTVDQLLAGDTAEPDSGPRSGER